MLLSPPNSPESEYTTKLPRTRGRLVVVSNRLPITIKRHGPSRYSYNKSCGGLVSGLSGLTQDTEFDWYGWPGMSVPDAELPAVETELKDEYNSIPVPLDDELADTHYNGFSNSTLWPLLHYQECFSYDKKDWEAYKQVNRLFASRIAADSADGDVIWVHDYHLFLLPTMLREEGARLNKSFTIGFFLHTPFPASDHFKILPVHQELLRGLLSSDVIGFHTTSYADNFKATCADVLSHELNAAHRVPHVGVYPIGIDPHRFTRELAKSEVQSRSTAVRDRYGNTRLIVGVDRLDYIKGLPRKVHALSSFLSRHPEWIGHVTLVQVVIPSRETLPEYRKLADNLKDLVDAVNEKYGSPSYQPIHLLHCSVPFDELVALYAAADACLITSTRDGMNLVAYEYVASQDARQGVLLLSEFAGAAEQLSGCVQFNPHDIDGIADAIEMALSMGKEQRRSNHERMRSCVLRHTSASWGRTFVAELERSAGISAV